MNKKIRRGRSQRLAVQEVPARYPEAIPEHGPERTTVFHPTFNQADTATMREEAVICA